MVIVGEDDFAHQAIVMVDGAMMETCSPEEMIMEELLLTGGNTARKIDESRGDVGDGTIHLFDIGIRSLFPRSICLGTGAAG